MRITAFSVALFLIGLGSIHGCGSGSGTVVSSTRANVITRATADSFSTDAKVLAARESQDGWISTDTARQIDTDLQRIRTFATAVDTIHARPDDDPYSLLVAVNKGVTWESAWSANRIETGVGAIDALSRSYRVTGVSTVSAFPEYTLYKLTFADPLSTKFVAIAYKKTDMGIRDAYSNYLSGSGDNITRQVSGGRIYQISRGWGDCAAGCIFRHTWQFTIATDGTISVMESGAPLGS
jgi:hypothetical protein